ncbi:hypothetical protein ACFWYW_14665 [Nonomuraea sp. NPDC059023]|uniref:hypothetical protein n=1 Tax=unclassified Nonomuraea TaxID=2593643 RepID=UPI0036CC2DC2
MSDHLVSLIRTYAAIWIPSIAAFLAKFGIDLPVDQMTIVVVALAVSAYYAVVRAGEKRWPWLGVLFFSKRQPSYTSTSGPGTTGDREPYTFRG